MIKLLFISLTLWGSGPAEDTKQVLTDLALEQLYQQFSSEDFQFELNPRWIPNSLLETNPSNIKTVQLVGKIGRYATFEVIYVRPRTVEETQIQFKVEARQRVPVAAERLLNGVSITADKLEMQWVEVNLDRDRLVPTFDALLGNTTRRLINPGQPFQESEVSAPLLVEAGQGVQLIYQNAGIELALSCEARQSGTKSEKIVVYCAETRKKYQAEIKQTGVAEWIRTL